MYLTMYNQNVKFQNLSKDECDWTHTKGTIIYSFFATSNLSELQPYADFKYQEKFSQVQHLSK